MSHHQPNRESSSLSNSSDHSFPFQHEDNSSHQTLLPEGIFNDDDDILPWPLKSAKDLDTDKMAALRIRKLPQDMTAREFAGLFLMADGYLESELISENDERVGIAKFSSRAGAEKTKTKMSTVSTGPYANLAFEIVAKRGANDVFTPPATLSSSSKSTGSNGSMPHISRLASYVKERPADSQIGLEDFYGNGSSSLPKNSSLSTSVPTNFSTSAGATVWSPTSPRFGVDIGKSPPNGLTMLPPASNRDDDSWNRSGTQSSVNSRFGQLSINTAAQSQDGRVQQSPNLSAHPGTTPVYASIDDSLHSIGIPRSAYSSTSQSSIYHTSSPPKHYMTSPTSPYGQANGGSGYGSHRMGPPTPINTNPADQNPPCNTLYVGNLPLATTEEELKSLFSRQSGYRRLCYRTKSNGPMCFVEFEDVHYAIESLKLLQGVILSSSVKGGIRLSFSKNPLGVRKMDGSHSNGNGAYVTPVSNNNGTYNAMHAPPGLHSGQSHSHSHQQQHAAVNLWR